MSPTISRSAFLLLFLAGCSGADGAPFDSEDAGEDTASRGTGRDAAGGDDGGGIQDATVTDGTVPGDSGAADTGNDAGAHDASVDTGTDAGDAGPGPDAGQDAAPDASIDSGSDAGVDAGPPPTCAVAVTPATGTTTTTFTGTLSSANATTCSAVVDGTSPLSIACNGSITWPGSSFGGAGVHSAIVSVSGATGAAQCATSWTVTDPSVPTCTVSVTPARGKVSDTYTGQLTSAGASSCTYRVDDGGAVGIPCNGTIPFQGSVYGAGTHVVVVSASGDGASTCSATWIETP